MIRSCLVSVVLLLLPASLGAQPAEPPLGLKLGKVPDALYSQIPQLPKNQGLLVESVGAQSRARRGGLRQFDVILSLDGMPLADSKAALEKLRGMAAGQSTELTIIRSGREMVLAFDPTRQENALENEYLTPKGFLKPGGPPAVTIQLQPRENGRLNLILSFYSANSGKMERLAYTGQLGDIEQQIRVHAYEKRLPEQVQDLVDVALKRVRTINQNQKDRMDRTP